MHQTKCWCLCKDRAFSKPADKAVLYSYVCGWYMVVKWGTLVANVPLVLQTVSRPAVPLKPPHPLPKGSRYGISLSFCVFCYFSLCLSVYLVSVFASVLFLSFSLPSTFAFLLSCLRLFTSSVFLSVFLSLSAFRFLFVSVASVPSFFQLLNCLSSLYISVSRLHFPFALGTQE